MTEPLIIARAGDKDIALLPAMANRHGCITGATGTGKTISLQVLAEHFSRIGNSVRNWITGDQITDTGCSLKLVKRDAIDRVRLFTGMHRFLPTLVRYAGFKVVEMPVNHRPRQFGVSKYGAMNRAFRGLADCFAVRWMGTRMLKYDAHEE